MAAGRLLEMYHVTEPLVEESSLDASFNCEEQAGELPTRALSEVVVFHMVDGMLTLQDLEVLDGEEPVPLNVVGRLTKIDKIMDPIPGDELGPTVHLTGVTEWSLEYDNLNVTVWVSSATADYKLVSAAPAYASIWAVLDKKALLPSRISC